MAFKHGVPSLPYELLAEEEYNHAEYKQSEYRDILALIECCSRNVGAYFKYFPHDQKNRAHMDKIMMESFLTFRPGSRSSPRRPQPPTRKKRSARSSDT